MKIRAALFLFCFLLSAFWLPSSGRADCFNPSDTAGSLRYNSTLNVLQYCDGGAWVNTGPMGNTTTGLLGWWKFDDGSGTSAVDSSGNNNTGTLTGSPLPAWTTGINNGALSFNGSTAYVNISATDAFLGTGALTVSAWIYPTATGYGTIFFSQNSSNYYAFVCMYDTGSNHDVWCDNAQGTGPVVESAAGAFPLNTWTFLTLVRAADGKTMTMYVNGVQNSGPTVTCCAAVASGSTMRIGNDNSGDYFHGTIDDVRVYNRALSAADITTLYGSTGGSYPSGGSASCGAGSNITFTAIGGGQCRAFITTTGAGTFTVPTNWTTTNTIEAIGSGGQGFGGSTGGSGGTGGSGAGGGAYAAVTNQSLSGTMGYYVGPANDLTATYLCSDNTGNCSVSSGSNGSSVILVACSGINVFGGASPGNCNGFGVSLHGLSAGGAGGTGGSAHAGGGGGGAGGPTGAGAAGSSSTGAGGTGDGTTTAAGANGTEWSASPAYGSGGGGNGAATAGVGGAAGAYGGGGGGGRASGQAGGAGAQGIIVVTYTPSAGGGACSSPAGSRGDTIYSSASHVMQYCDGLNWISIGPVPGVGGAGCAGPPAGSVEGAIIYSSANHVMQYCDGTNWNALGGIVPITGLVGWWNFDEGSGTTAADSSGNGNTGTLKNSPTWTTSGKINGALTFSGTNQEMDANTGLPGTSTATFTVSLWLKTAGSYNILFYIGNYVDCAGNQSSGVDLACQVDGAGESNMQGHIPINNSAWHHVAFVVNGSTTQYLYVDGVLDVTAARTLNMSSGTGLCLAGNCGSTPYYPGTIDDVRVYNRALSAAEVWKLYLGQP